MRIAVVDGQGGGIGRAVIERLRAEFGGEVDILALGTNALATSAMLKAGANDGATGENAVAVNAARADIIVGSVGIIAADSILGELTPGMAKAIAQSPARKVLIPMNRCNIHVVGVVNEPLPYYIDCVVEAVKNYIKCIDKR